MACNSRVSAQVQVLADTYGTPRYKVEQEIFWEIFEEEFKKNPNNGWAAWEDPTDCLQSALENSDDKAWVAELLADYRRFYRITGWEPDLYLMRVAESYIR